MNMKWYCNGSAMILQYNCNGVQWNCNGVATFLHHNIIGLQRICDVIATCSLQPRCNLQRFCNDNVSVPCQNEMFGCVIVQLAMFLKMRIAFGIVWYVDARASVTFLIAIVMVVSN